MTQQGVRLASSPFLHSTRPVSPTRTVPVHPHTESLLLRFSHCIVRYRITFGLCSFAFIIATALLALFSCHLPDLSDPSADFIAIRTEWSANVQQFAALLSETRSSPWRAETLVERQRRSLGQSTRFTTQSEHTLLWPKRNEQFRDDAAQAEQLKLCFGDYPSLVASTNLWTTYQSHGRLVVSLDEDPSFNDSSLHVDAAPLNIFTQPGAFASLCELQSRIYELDVFKQECVHSIQQVHNATNPIFTCCPAWSVPNMVAALLGRSSCTQVLSSELIEVNQLLVSCLPVLRNNTRRRVCWDSYGSDPTLLCPLVTPVSCLQSPLIALILATSLPDAMGNNWRTTLIQLPIRRADSLSLFLALESAYQDGKWTSNLPVPLYIHGMYLHAHNELVSEMIVRDTFWLVVALITLLVLLAVGTGTVVIPLITLMGIGWSLLTAYALYSRVLCIPHFPLLNLMAIVLAIGLGADDLLVYYQVWKASPRCLRRRTAANHFALPILSNSLVKQHQSSGSNKSEHERVKSWTNRCLPSDDYILTVPYHQLALQLRFTLRHAIPSMALTSIATALGLLINFLSSIVAVQRFTLFALLIVFCNFFYIILVAPVFFVLLSSFRILSRNTMTCTVTYFESISIHFSNVVLRARFFLSFLFIVILTVCTYSLLFNKRFTLPSGGGQTSFLKPTHPFETFINTYTDQFWAERNLHQLSTLIPVHFVWGFRPADDRSFWSFIYKEPIGSTRWIPDEKLNLTALASREWLLKFCDEQLRGMPYLFHVGTMNFQNYGLAAFDRSHLNPLVDAPLWCPLGRFTNSLSNYIFAQDCSTSKSRCCTGTGSPTISSLSAWQFRHCLEEYTLFEDHILPREHQSGFRFLANGSNDPTGLVVTVLTNLSILTHTHEELLHGVCALSVWFRRALTTAPDFLQGHLVFPTLGAFEVEKNVTEYVYWGILGAVLLAALLVLLSTRSIWIATIAFISLFTCLTVTGLLLVLVDNWTLGIVEGLVLSLAAGLAIDPCLHLALSVKHAAPGERCGAGLGWTCKSIGAAMYVLNTAVTGSALSTALAGLSMIACQLLCYHQIGVFLCILMISSWLVCYVMFASNLACLSSLSELRRNCR